MTWFDQVRTAASDQTVAATRLLRAALDVREWRVLKAERHAREGRIEAAETAYRQILARQPDHKSGLAGLGRLLLRERRFEEAVGTWRHLVDLEPQRAGPSFQLARALHRSGRHEEAASQYLAVVALDPLHEKAFASLEQLSDRLLRENRHGRSAIDIASQLSQQLLTLQTSTPKLGAKALGLLATLQSTGDPATAVERFKELAALKPGIIEPHLQLSRLYSRQQQHEEAARSFRAVLDLDPNHVEALTGYSQALEQIDRNAAIRHVVSWSKRHPNDAAPRLELARLYQKSHDWDHAEAAYRDILEEMPDNPQALTRLAQVLSRNLTRIEPALDVWRRLADSTPTSPAPLVQRAQLLQRVNRSAEAEAEYRAALKRAPHDEAAMFGLARLLVADSRWQEAVPFYESLHILKRQRTDVLLGLGRCFERLDRAEEALAAYDKVLALDPTNVNGLLYRGRLLRQLGLIEEAIKSWREACRRTPANGDAWSELVFMLATAERDSEALAALDDAEEVLPATPSSWIKLGLAAQAGQFNDRAVRLFERAIAAEPNEPSHRTRLGQHYLRRGILDGAYHNLLASRELKPADVVVARQLVDTVHALNVLGVDHIALQAAPHRCGELLSPEGLYALVRQIADRDVVPYTPVPLRIVNVSSSLAGGGAERQLVNLLRGLSDTDIGLELSLFCISLARRSRRDFFMPLLQETSVDIATPDDTALETYLANPDVAPHARLIRAFPADMVAPIAFWLGEFRRRKPQIVHAWQDGTNLTAVVAALLAGVPRIVLGTRSVRPDNPRRRLKRFMQAGYRSVLGHPSVILSNNSRAGANDYADWLGVDPSAIEVVYNGIDFEQLSRTVTPARVAETRAILGIPTGAPVVGSAFRMSEEKRPLLWVEAAAEVARQDARVHFIVYGDGPMRVDMMHLARSRGIADRLHLPGPEDDIASRYKAMDVVMLTSRHEGLPNVLLEAQSLGIPVVAPDVGGVSETVWQGVTGFAVPNAEASSLAQHVLLCLRDKAWLGRAQTEGPAFVRERFGIPAMLRRTLEVYRIIGS